MRGLEEWLPPALGLARGAGTETGLQIAQVFLTNIADAATTDRTALP
jgi:hypothetical protein